MNARSVPEWIAKDADEAIPQRVRDRVLLRFERKCAECGNDIRVGDKWILDHEIALINGGQHRENNLRPLCRHICAHRKDVADVAQKAKNYRIRLKHYGLWQSKWPAMPGTKRSGIKKKMDRTVERR